GGVGMRQGARGAHRLSDALQTVDRGATYRGSPTRCRVLTHAAISVCRIEPIRRPDQAGSTWTRQALSSQWNVEGLTAARCLANHWTPSAPIVTWASPGAIYDPCSCDDFNSASRLIKADGSRAIVCLCLF